jgi:hypothetical protein
MQLPHLEASGLFFLLRAFMTGGTLRERKSVFALRGVCFFFHCMPLRIARRQNRSYTIVVMRWEILWWKGWDAPADGTAVGNAPADGAAARNTLRVVAHCSLKEAFIL